jgi:RNA polymerase sigma-70 factor (ECF subfamily)
MVTSTSGYDEMFRREYPLLVRTAALILGDHEHARDVAQDAMIQLYNAWDEVSTHERPGAWARRVCIRIATRARTRRHKADAGAILRHSLAESTDPAAVVAGLEVWKAVLLLPVNQRAAIVLRYAEDLSTDEIADILGCDTSTVRVHLHRGRKALGLTLREEVDDVVG